MYYYVYQITNLVNNKIYVGVHKTNNLDDGYMGSGKIIRRAIEKHGTDNFRKDILKMCDTYEDALAYEKEIVTDEFLMREDVYNLRRGGTGGFDFINKSPDIINERNRILNENMDRDDPEYRRKLSEGIKNSPYKKSQTCLDHMKKMRSVVGSSEKGLALMKQFNTGSMWINNGIVSKKIKKEDPLPDGWIKGRLKAANC